MNARWQALAPYEDHWRFRLTAQLARCGSAPAQLVLYQNGKWCPVPLTFTVYDSLGVVCPDLCRVSTSGEECPCTSADSVPAGTFGVAKHYADSCRWEVLVLGRGCCELVFIRIVWFVRFVFQRREQFVWFVFQRCEQLVPSPEFVRRFLLLRQ